MEQLGKIFFYEDRNFKGRFYECSTDCAELSSHFGHCNSIKVEKGAWVVYERPNFMGHQYVVMRGEYPDFKNWNGFNDTIRSCRIIRHKTSSSHKVRIYEHPDFSGEMVELTEDVPSLPDQWQYPEVQSAHVKHGAWVFYELPTYKGRQYLLEKGEYGRYEEWRAPHATVGSIRRVVDPRPVDPRPVDPRPV